jgi:5-methylcytosine-specific restriction endonuclease McrA
MARNYKKEYANYQGTPEQIAKRSQRNKARRALEKAGLVHKGDGMDVDHKKPISKGGGNARSNLRPVDANDNRSFPRTKKARMR